MKAIGFTGTVSFDGEWLVIDHETRAKIPGLIGMWPGVQMITKAVTPKGSIQVPISNVMSLNFKGARGKTRGAQGYIGFKLAGTRPGGFRDDQRVMFFPQQQADFEAVARVVQDAIASRNTSPPAESSSVADELRKLGDLKRDGLLTQAEFDEQKRRLL